MKLVLAIVSSDDAAMVNNSLTEAGFQATKLATTGGFLKSGNTTFLIGVDDEKVENVMEILHKQSRRRTQMIPTANGDTGMLGTYPIEVAVGGATVFVLDVDQFQKL